MNQLATQQERLPMDSVGMSTTGAGAKIAPQNLGEVVKFAEVMCRADIALPQHLRGNAGACMAVALQALEWQMSPFAVASKSYAVGGRIAYEAQLIAAVVNTRSGIKGRLKYRYDGEGTAMTCTVTGILNGDECEYTTPQIGSITVKNSPLWKSDPQQQLGYFAARSWARRHCPEVILGVYDRDEAEQFRGPENARDVTPKSSLSDRLALAREATQQPQDVQEGFDPAHVARETSDALTGEIIEPGDSSTPVDATADSPSASQEDGGQTTSEPSSSPSLSPSDRGLLIECCAKFMSITVDASLDTPQQKRGVLETAKNTWKEALRPELHDHLKGIFLSADAIIKGEADRSKAITEFAYWLECAPEELGG